MTKKTIRVGALAAGLALVLSMPAACHHGSGVSPSVESRASDVGASPPTSVLTHGASAEATMRGVGPAETLLEAAEALQLTESQREKVHKLKDQLGKYEQNARSAFRILREDVADQVRAGRIDLAGVRGDEDRAAGALTVHVDEGAEAMNGLHAVLEPTQRSAVVAAVRALEKRGSSRSPFEEPLGEVDAILQAFAGSNFDAWTTVPAPQAPPAATLRQRIDRELEDLARAVPALGAGQRARLASTIEER